METGAKTFGAFDVYVNDQLIHSRKGLGKHGFFEDNPQTQQAVLDAIREAQKADH